MEQRSELTEAESRRLQQLVGLLGELISEHGKAGAAVKLGVGYRTVLRSLAAGKLSRGLRMALEKHLLLREGAEVPESPWAGRLDDLEQGRRELAEGLEVLERQQTEQTQQLISVAGELQSARGAISELVQKAGVRDQEVRKALAESLSAQQEIRRRLDQVEKRSRLQPPPLGHEGLGLLVVAISRYGWVQHPHRHPVWSTARVPQRLRGHPQLTCFVHFPMRLPHAPVCDHLVDRPATLPRRGSQKVFYIPWSSCALFPPHVVPAIISCGPACLSPGTAFDLRHPVVRGPMSGDDDRSKERPRVADAAEGQATERSLSMHVHSRGSKVWNRKRIAVFAMALLVVAPLLLGAGAGAAAMNAVGLGLAAMVVRRLSARKRTQRREGVWKPCLRCGW